MSTRKKAKAKAPAIRTPKPDDKLTFPRHEVERMWRLLARAQESALLAAPRAVPAMKSGAQLAIEAWDDMNMVRDVLAAALGGAS